MNHDEEEARVVIELAYNLVRKSHQKMMRITEEALIEAITFTIKTAREREINKTLRKVIDHFKDYDFTNKPRILGEILRMRIKPIRREDA